MGVNIERRLTLWSGLSLELLARAALANVHPALLAEPDKMSSNLVSALGFEPVGKNFAPKSIAVSEVFRRLVTLLPGFQIEHENFSIQHTGRRNAELHSGEIGFGGVKGASWQPHFYQVCKVLLASMEITLEEFVGPDEALAANAIIAAAVDESAKAVKGDVDAHRRVWNGKEEGERTMLRARAEVWVSRQDDGHPVICPACTSPAVVFGSPVAAAIRTLYDDTIIERQEYLPTHFECVACGLKINNLSRLNVMGLADRYPMTLEYHASEYYGPPPPDMSYGYEDDNDVD